MASASRFVQVAKSESSESWGADNDLAVRASINSKIGSDEEVGSGGDGSDNSGLIGSPLVESSLVEG